MTTPAAAPAIDPDYSINRLVIGMWNDAEREARKGDTSARDWLYSEGVLWLDIILSIHPDHSRRYLRRALKCRKKKTQQEAPGRAQQYKTIQTHSPSP